MRKLDERTTQALCALEDDPNYRIILEWLQASAGDQDDTLRTSLEPAIMFQAQGAVRELLEICKLSAEPRVILGKLRQEKSGVKLHAQPRPASSGIF